MSHKHQSHRPRHYHEKPPEASSVVPKQPASLPPADLLFTIDRKGDVQNLRYGSIDKYKVPKYRTTGYGRLLGLDRRFKIVSQSETERNVDDEASDVSNKSHTFPLLLKRQAIENPSSLLKTAPTNQNEFVEQQDYVKFDRKKRRLSHESDGQSTDLVRAGRTNGAPSESGSDSEDLLEDELEGQGEQVEQDAFETFKSHPDNRRHIELRKQVDHNPEDVEAWLDLISHQERYLMLSINKNEGKLNASQSRTVTDMRISLYEKAIAAVKDKIAKERLILGLMQEGSKIWETDKQLKEWNTVLRSTRSIDLRYKYLNFQQTNPIIFTYEKCVDAYLETFKLVVSIKDESYDLHCAYLTLRLTTFMSEAGFAERAIAIWQALLEYNFFRPDTGLNDSEAFESFWESEYPRIGEEGAKGWLSNSELEVPPRTDPDLSDLDRKNIFADWGRAEMQRFSQHVMPARTLDNTVEDDPFRVILFSDIKDFLFQSKTDQGRQYLIQGLLKFCDLPPLFDNTERCREWWVDPMLCDFDPNVMIGELTDINVLYQSPRLPVQTWNTQGCQGKGILDFGTCVLTQLSELQPANDQLGEYVVALHLQTSPKAARKLAKKLLKQRPDSLRLYNSYALVEARENKFDIADNVWSTALSMADSFGSLRQQSKVLLWHSWIWELMVQERSTHASNLLIEVIPSEIITANLLQIASEPHDISVGQRLRAEAYFRENIAKQTAQNCEMIVEFTALFALLRYFYNGQDIEEVFTIYRSTLSVVKQQRYPQIFERLHQSRALFAHFHAVSSKSGFKPIQLLPIFEDSMSLFPNNSMFSGLHERYLKHAGMMDRVRTMDLVGKTYTSTTSPSLYIISKEILRPTYSGSTVHSVRRAFANATAAECEVRHCATIWLLWVKWEVSLISLQPEIAKKQARDVYLSALRHCPWHKELYLAAFAEPSLNAVLGDRELERIFRSMSERGLRIRHDISDILDDEARD